MLVLFGGPAGAGKSTLARAWCGTRARAAHIELDAVRELIVAGRADPQQPGAMQAEQYALSVAAVLSLAEVFLRAGYDVAVDDVLPPRAFKLSWQPHIAHHDWRVVIVLPELSVTLDRSARRAKRVLESISRCQHAASTAWPEHLRVDTSSMSVAESLSLVQACIDRQGG